MRLDVPEKACGASSRIERSVRSRGALFKPSNACDGTAEIVLPVRMIFVPLGRNAMHGRTELNHHVVDRINL